MLRPAALLLLALPLAACGGDDGPQGADRFPAVIEDPVGQVRADSALAAPDSVTVEGTLRALGTDPTAVTPALAVANVGGWIRQVEAASFEGRDAIAENLRALRDALGSDPLDGAAIGAILGELGTQTAEAAPQAEGRTRAGLVQLASVLQRAAERLTGAPEAPADSAAAPAE